jgi:hypothetical protein
MKKLPQARRGMAKPPRTSYFNYVVFTGRKFGSYTTHPGLHLSVLLHYNACLPVNTGNASFLCQQINDSAISHTLMTKSGRSHSANSNPNIGMYHNQQKLIRRVNPSGDYALVTQIDKFLVEDRQSQDCIPGSHDVVTDAVKSTNSR